jgi:hypothetical protein
MINKAFHVFNKTSDGRKNRSSDLIQRWTAFFFCLFLVWIFMFVIAPAIQNTSAVKPLADFIEESGIDASALFYTEVEESSEAELHMRSTMKYPPRKHADTEKLDF